MGGGGFSSPPGDPSLDRYVLDAARRAAPAHLPAAHGGRRRRGADPALLRRLPPPPLRADAPVAVPARRRAGRRGRVLLGQDVLYVGGGSMLNLLAVWRAHGVDAILREAWERGIVLCGISAGSMCWFEAGVTTSFGAPRPVPGLGLLPGSNSVHYDSEPARRPCFHEAIRTEAVPPGWGVDDGVGLLFVGRELVEAVSARRGAGAYWVEETRGEARGDGAPARARCPAARSSSCRRRSRSSSGARRGCGAGKVSAWPEEIARRQRDRDRLRDDRRSLEPAAAAGHGARACS